MLPDRRAQLEALGVPVGQINALLTGNVINDLQGNVSYQPSMNYAAAMGVRTGLQGSEFARRIGASDYLNRVDAAKQRGATNATNALSAITNTQTISPETQIQLGQENANLAAAPDPQMAANAAIGAYQSALNRASSYYQAPTSQSKGSPYMAAPSFSGSSFSAQGGGMPVGGYSGTAAPAPTQVQSQGGFGGWTPNSWSGQASSGPSSTPLVINGQQNYDPGYYEQIRETYNPGLYDSGIDWSEFE